MRLGLLLLLFAGCQKQSLIGANGVLRVDESQLDFGERWLESKTTKQLQLANTGRAALSIRFSTSGPFEVNSPLLLGGGESVALEVSFTPTELGAVEAKLSIEIEGGQQLLTLRGTGIDPPPCDSIICRTATLDAVTARCVLTPVPDGEACGDACLERAHCEAGGCVGDAKSCDDRDRCTVDACDSSSGCTHAPVICRPSNPCMIGRCDPTSGCVESPALDGIGCGEADCITAHVCIQGQCVSRAVPDGAACGKTTVCQAEGRCAAQVCVQPAASSLVKLWSHQVIANHWTIGLVGDDAGSVFTVECANAGTFRAQCELLSLAVDGAVRFRTPFPYVSDTGSGGTGGQLIVAGSVVIVAVEPSRILAVNRVSGLIAWSLDTRTLGLFPPSVTHVRPVAVSFDGARTIVVALEASSSGSIGASALAGLELSTGALVHSFPLPAQATSLVLDREANIYLGHGSGGGIWLDTLTSFDASWAVRWQRVSAPADLRIRILAAVNGTSLFWTQPAGSELASTSSGALGTASGIQGNVSGVVWSDQALFVLHRLCPTVSCPIFIDQRLHLTVRPSDGSRARDTVLPVLSWYTSPWLTDRGTALLAVRDATGTFLREFDSAAALAMQCPFALEDRIPRARLVFAAGRYLLSSAEDTDGFNPRVDCWSLPGYAPALRGWVSERGGPEQDLRGR